MHYSLLTPSNKHATSEFQVTHLNSLLIDFDRRFRFVQILNVDIFILLSMTTLNVNVCYLVKVTVFMIMGTQHAVPANTALHSQSASKTKSMVLNGNNGNQPAGRFQKACAIVEGTPSQFTPPSRSHFSIIYIVATDNNSLCNKHTLSLDASSYQRNSTPVCQHMADTNAGLSCDCC